MAKEDNKNKKKKEAKKNIEKKETAKKVEKNMKEEKVKTEVVKKSKKNDDKMLAFLDFFEKYRYIVYGALGGILVTVLIVILIWPDRIAKLKDGTEPVVKIKGLTVTADVLYEDLKDSSSIDSLLNMIDNKILEKKYPSDDDMEDEIKSQVDNYYNMYKQYYNMDKETFLSSNGFKKESDFFDFLRLQHRRTKYYDDYVKSQITDKEINSFYEDKVYGDINTKHILVAAKEDASDEEKKKAKKLAEEIISKLDNGATFDEVKEEYKDSITYEELGYKSYNANLEAAYLEEMQKLSNDSYSKTPVKTSYGYHIVYRIDQKEKPKLKDVKDEIIESIAKNKKEADPKQFYVVLDKMRNDAGLKFSDTVMEAKYKDYLSKNK